MIGSRVSTSTILPPHRHARCSARTGFHCGTWRRDGRVAFTGLFAAVTSGGPSTGVLVIPRPASRRTGFTLVELLVVIGIIALLIAVLMPALAGARAQANRLVCATNVRTLAQVALQYAHDNKGWIPRNYAHNEPPFPSWVDLLVRSMKRNLPTPPVGGAYTQAYDTAAGPFYAATPWLQCPVFPTEAQGVDYVINGWGKNAPNGGRSPLLKVTSIRRSG